MGCEVGWPTERKVYLVILQVPFSICSQVPDFILRVLQFLLYKLAFLVDTEAFHMVHAGFGSMPDSQLYLKKNKVIVR